MKRTIHIISCLLCVISAAYGQNYYWYKGQQIPLKIGNQRYILYEDNNKTDSDFPQVIEGGAIADYKDKKLKWGIVEQVTPVAPLPSLIDVRPQILIYNPDDERKPR